jgi:hypothetical protein
MKKKKATSKKTRNSKKPVKKPKKKKLDSSFIKTAYLSPAEPRPVMKDNAPGSEPIISLAVKYIRGNSSMRSLILANLAIISLAVYEHWSFIEVMMLYWAQSVLIGLFNIIRMMTLKKYTYNEKEGTEANVESSAGIKIGISAFFAVHYGIFHVVYLVFIYVFESILNPRGSFEMSEIYPGLALFAAYYLYDMIMTRRRDEETPNIMIIMIRPYARIVPMHLTILFGGWIIFMVGEKAAAVLVPIFMTLKAVVEVLSHSGLFSVRRLAGLETKHS